METTDASSFLLVGMFGGFAYLSFVRKQLNITYGLGLIGLGFMFQRFAELAPDKVSEVGYVTFLRNLRNVSFGAGLSFLGYVAATDGWRYFEKWREKRRLEAEQFQLSLKARKDAESPRPAAR